MIAQTVEAKADIPLVVDLDGTLIKSDLLFEALLQFLKKNPLYILFIIKWIFCGIINFKNKIAEYTSIDPSLLPYNKEFVHYLKNENKNGRILILATASHISYAKEIAAFLRLFSDVYATDDKCNLKGKKKLKVLQAKFGEKGFDYAGDSRQDLKIFSKARRSILVQPAKSLITKAKKNDNVYKIFNDNENKVLTYLKAIRVHQWLKNLLIFIPILTSHNWLNIEIILKSFVGFLAMGLCASGTYILNDLFDLPSDRSHPRKKNRPFASGDLSIVKGLLLSALLLVVGVTASFILNKVFLFFVLTYLFITFLYSFVLKKYVLIDTILLASLYTIRVIAGAELIHVHLSFWLLAFSIFIFYSLALLKRVTELQVLDKSGIASAKGRDYHFRDTESLRTMGIASGLLSVIVCALYINSSDVLLLYKEPRVLWLICPLLLYWINRLWLKTGRDEMHDDPVVFAIKDHGSQTIFFITGLLLYAATYL